MKKLNSFRLAFATAFMVCMMAVAFVSGGINVNAAQIAKLSIDENGILTVTGDHSESLMVKRPKTEVIDGIQVNAGNYYFENGKCTGPLKATKLVYFVDEGHDNYKLMACTTGDFRQGSATVAYGSQQKLFSGQFEGKIYLRGELHNGYYLDNNANEASRILYKVTNGIGNASLANGIISGVNYLDGKQITYGPVPADGFYVKNGVLQTGFSGLVYYTNGRRTLGLTGWRKLSGNIYYFSTGKAVTGWHYLPSYGKGVKKYRYLFSNAGVLYTNLIDYYGYNKFIQKDIKIITNKTTHNTTFYIKDANGNFTIPCVTVICATARKKNDTPKGTYRLEKTWRKRWFVYTKTHGAPYRYYQWAVHIKGTPTLFHSSTYRKTSAASLRSDLYNKLGTSCTTHCIRLQAKYAKMIFDIASKTNKKRRVPVQIITSKNEGPFGHVSLQKIKSGTKWDPTDPNKK